MLPSVNITILNGQLGLVASANDGIAGLIISGVSTSEIALAEAKAIFSTEEAEALGIDAAYDTANSVHAYKHISDFYAQAGQGAKLWIMIVANTTTMEDICDETNDLAKKLLQDAGGEIRLLGVTRTPDGSYSPTATESIDPDVTAAVIKLNALAESFAADYKPFRALIEGRAFGGNVGLLHDFKAGTHNRVGVVLGSDVAESIAGVGMALGALADLPVQRNIGRVRNGALLIVKGYLSDGNAVEDYEASWGAIHDKGYIFPRRYQGIDGYFYNDDPSATAETDDYSSLARGRVIDKAHRVTYATYVLEILDDVEVNEDGTLNAAIAKDYQAKIENALNNSLIANDEAVAVSATVDPTQNVQSTGIIKIALSVRPKAYAKNIDVELGFESPTNA